MPDYKKKKLTCWGSCCPSLVPAERKTKKKGSRSQICILVSGCLWPMHVWLRFSQLIWVVHMPHIHIASCSCDLFICLIHIAACSCDKIQSTHSMRFYSVDFFFLMGCVWIARFLFFKWLLRIWEGSYSLMLIRLIFKKKKIQSTQVTPTHLSCFERARIHWARMVF